VKILHLVDERWDSGLTAYALMIAELQQKVGEQVTVGVLAGKKAEALAHEKGLVTAPFESALGLRKILKRPWDVINAHTGRTHTWAVLTRSLSMSGRGSVPVIRTRGDARPLRVNALNKFIYRRTAGFIAASAHIGRQFEDELGLGENRFEVIYPAVTPDAALTAPPPDRVGILGRLDPVKGHAVFLEAAAHLLRTRPQTRFLIAGKEAGLATRLLANQAEQLGIAHAVEFLGYHPDARAFMRTCTVGVIASVGSEEISRACLEWMSVGRPVVATLVGSLPELVEPGESGRLVPPGDGTALAEAIGLYLDHHDTAVAHGRGGWERVRQHFSPVIACDRTEAFFRRFVH
jgi:glycosyltransferase involved in cell wall biosynthesis